MQLSYAMEMDTAHVGALADLSVKTTDTFACEEGMGAGMPVVYGTSEKQCKVLAQASDAEKVVGITQFVHKEQSTPYYKEGFAVPVVTRGRVWVKVDGDVTGGVAKFDMTNKVWSSTNGVEVPCAIFKTVGSRDGLAIVEIR